MSSLSVLDTNFSNPWRNTVEGYAALAWAVSALILTYTSLGAPLGTVGLWAVTLCCYLMATWWLVRTYFHCRAKLNLIGFGLEIINAPTLSKYVKPGYTWLGHGFAWDVDCTQRLYDLNKMGPDKFIPSRLSSSILSVIYRRRLPNKDSIGSHWIHGIGAHAEKPTMLSDSQWEGNTSVTGTTGAGKTVLIQCLIQQNGIKGQATLVIDPKSDKDLEKCARQAASVSGRPYYRVSLTDPENSHRIDPLANWLKISDIASRLGMLVASNTEDDAFTAYSWQVLYSLAGASVFVHDRPTIANLRSLIELGFTSLVVRVLKKHLAGKVNRPEDLDQRINECETEVGQLNLLMEMYGDLPPESKHELCNGLISLSKSNEQWHHKMIAGLKPKLIQLSAGEMGPLLSPDPDSDDERPIVDVEHIIREAGVLYIGLDSLGDRPTSSSVGSIFLADFAGIASRIYSQMEETRKRDLINLYVDEAPEIVENSKAGAIGLVQLLNKGRGSGYRLVVLSQAISDWAKALGSTDAAYQLLGNTNNKIVLRVTDPASQEFFEKMFGETTVKTAQYSISNANSGNDGDPTSYSGGYGERLTETAAPIFPAAKFGQLPNSEFFGIFAGGKIVKCRLPICIPTLDKV